MNAQAAIENITPDTPVPPVDKGNGNTDGSKLYSGPLPLDARRFLVSARGPILVRDLAGTCASRWRWLGPATACSTSAPRPSGRGCGRRSIPSRLPAGAAAHEPIATLYLQDVYAGLEPHVQRGEVKTIRVVRELQKTVRIDPSLRAFGFQFPVISCGATYAGKDVIGEVDVNPDGSAYFQVPSGVPLYFMALDAGRPGGAADAELHAPDAGRSAGLRRLPRIPAAIRLCGTLAGLGLEPKQAAAAGVGQRRVRLLADRPAGARPALRPVPPPHRPDRTRIDLTGDKTDLFNVSYDVLARERQGGRGTSYVNWIPTYNGQEWNILQVHAEDVGLAAEQAGRRDPVRPSRRRRQAAGRAERRRAAADPGLDRPERAVLRHRARRRIPNAPGCRQMYPQGPGSGLGGRGQAPLCRMPSRRQRSRGANGRGSPNPQLNPFLLAPLAQHGRRHRALRQARVCRHERPRLPSHPGDVHARCSTCWPKRRGWTCPAPSRRAT